MDDKLIFNNGTELSGYLVESTGRLFLYMRGITMREAFNMLMDPENVSSISWKRFDKEGTVTGYLKLYSITEEMNGQITAALKPM